MQTVIKIDSKKSITSGRVHLCINGVSTWVASSLFEFLHGRTSVTVSDEPFRGAIKCDITYMTDQFGPTTYYSTYYFNFAYKNGSRRIYVCGKEFTKFAGFDLWGQSTVYIRLGRKSRAKNIPAAYA